MLAEEEDNNTDGDGAGEGNDPPPASKKTDPDPKMVPESDLMAVKSQRDDLKTKLTTTEGEAASWQTKFNDVNAKFTTATTELESLKTVQGDLDKLTAKSEDDSKLLDAANNGLVARTKDLILSSYPKLDKDKLKDKSQVQLDIILDTLEDVAPSGRKLNDPGPASNNGTGSTPLELAAAEIAAAKGK